MIENLQLNYIYSLDEIVNNTTYRQREDITKIYENRLTFNSYDDITNELISKHSDRTREFFYLDPDTDNPITISVRLGYLAPIKEDLSEGMQWSDVRESITRFSQSYLLEQIRNRYAFFERPLSGLSNIIIDNYAPKLMYVTGLEQTNIQSLNLPKTIYTMSPWFAQYFGATLIPTEQLCRVLGYNLKDIKNLITKVKRKNYVLTMIGYGGTSVNTIHWLTEMMKFTQSVNLFKQLEIFEPDIIEVSNLLRFPKNPYIENGYGYSRNASKLRLLANDEISLLSKNKVAVDRNKIDGSRLFYSSAKMDYAPSGSSNRHQPKANHVFYGAPGIETRASFEGIGHFISATHNGNDAHLWLNPTQDSDLQVESYGLIQLTPFFMNQLRLAIGLLETLATEDLDLKQPDKLLLEYSFDGEAKLSTNRTYNFQLGNHSGLVATETEADIPF